MEKYCQSLRCYLSFCLASFSNFIIPANTITAAKFLSQLREKGYSKFSIGLALTSLKWLNGFFPGISGDLEDKFLGRIVESAKRNVFSVKNQKLPFSKAMIRDMMRVPPYPSLEQLRDALVPCLSFSLLLRNDELIHLSCRHMALTDRGMVFNIVSSKRDVYRKGKSLYLARQEGEYSVLRLLLRYMAKAKLGLGENKFLFGRISGDGASQALDGRVSITYQECLGIVKRKVADLGLNAKDYATHSSRSGAATSLASCVTPFELMASGRWADARSLNSYVEIGVDRRFGISENLFL